ncbi:hydrogenase expression/formation protein HypE [Candidatus Aerophobetes bacterium Ae_b3a]|nr:MAG: hydrogenase expression/formation protein HypE [Candidatus Aerophobetes bacterium Ae_b3a]
MKEKILLSHGSGGRLSHQLIKELFLKKFDNSLLEKLGDSAIFEEKNIRWAFSTDSYVIKPLFFPGGDIGKLAVSGTINDLAVAGATPLFLSCALIIEEGLELSILEKIISSMKETATRANVQIITGDTKVVEHGSADGLFINTSGVGIVTTQENLSPQRIEVNDRIIINGTIGDHSIATLSKREEFDFQTEIKSDCAPLNDLIDKIIPACPGLKMMRDPTRGGLATVLNEVASEQSFAIELWEKKIPIRQEVASICEILGFDPLYLANEGKVIFIVKYQEVDKLLTIARAHPLGKESHIIGKVLSEPKGKVYLRTEFGSRRIIDVLTGDQLPRIC